MEDALPACPQCSSTYTYLLGVMLVCPQCGHEWTASSPTDTSGDPDADMAGDVVTDSVGNVLANGDTITVIKNLKVKGSPTGIKAGTKVRNIRLVKGVGDHDIDCKVDGIGPIQLKSSVVRKA